MSNNRLRIVLDVAVLLVAIAALVATVGCGSRGFPTGVYNGTGDNTGLITEFKADGTVSISDNTGIVWDTTMYKVSGNQIVFSGGKTCFPSEGTYTWAFDGKALKFTFVSDNCADRKGALTSSDWIKE